MRAYCDSGRNDSVKSTRSGGISVWQAGDISVLWACPLVRTVIAITQRSVWMTHEKGYLPTKSWIWCLSARKHKYFYNFIYKWKLYDSTRFSINRAACVGWSRRLLKGMLRQEVQLTHCDFTSLSLLIRPYPCPLISILLSTGPDKAFLCKRFSLRKASENAAFPNSAALLHDFACTCTDVHWTTAGMSRCRYRQLGQHCVAVVQTG